MNPGRDTVLRTARLSLEALAPGHLEALWEAAGGSWRELRPWLMWAVELDESSMAAFIENAVISWEQGRDYVFAIGEGGRPVGVIGLHGVDRATSAAELGYWIATQAAGRGLMTEAGFALLDFAFRVLGLHRVELHAAPGNVASVRVAEKLGFRREGILRDGSRGEGGWHDAIVFGLLSDDPRLVQPGPKTGRT